MKKVLITGGTGSLGLALSRHLITNDVVERLVIFSRDEQKQARMHASYPPKTKALRFLLGDVRDREALLHACYGCDTVIHTAALKRVDNVACQPIEIKKTNVDGTQNVLEAALEAGVKKVLLVSTDKAVAPENIYGATKMLAEHLTTSFNAIGYPQGLRSSVVRFGNLWYSHGSVLELWIEAAKAGQDLLITDTHMTRFIMTLKQACDFILEAIHEMEGGEIFVPQLLCFRLVDLAEAVLTMYGTKNAQITVMGLRPGGEKIHERMISDDEPKRTLECKTKFLIMPSHRTWSSEPYQGGPLLPENTVYASDWPDPLPVDKLMDLLKKEAPER